MHSALNDQFFLIYYRVDCMVYSLGLEIVFRRMYRKLYNDYINLRTGGIKNVLGPHMWLFETSNSGFSKNIRRKRSYNGIEYNLLVSGHDK